MSVVLFKACFSEFGFPVCVRCLIGLRFVVLNFVGFLICWVLF